MHARNPFRRIDLGMWPTLRERVGANDSLQCTDARFIWGTIEHYCAMLSREVTLYHDDFDLACPEALREDDYAWLLLQWLKLGEVTNAALSVGALSVRTLLSGLERLLVDGNLLAACPVARSMLEQAAWLDEIALEFSGCDFEEEKSVSRPFLRDELNERLPKLRDVLYPSMWRSRFNWDQSHLSLSAAEARRAQRRIPEQYQSQNVVTVLERIEKRLGRVGLVHYYGLLCDSVHPSRGSRELLFAGFLTVDGTARARQFEAVPPSDSALLDRTKRVIGPALRFTFDAVCSVSDRLVPVVNTLCSLTRIKLVERGHDVDRLLKNLPIVKPE